MNYFNEMNSRLATAMSVDVLDNNDSILPLAWQVMPGLRENPDERSFKAPILDPAAVAAYVEACKQMLKDGGQALLNEIGPSTENKTALLVARGPIREALNESWNPEIGRPSKPIFKKLGFAAGITPFIKSAQKHHKEDPSFIQNVMRQQMANLDKNLEGIHWMFFKQQCEDDRPSVGWLSEDEKQNFLKALSQLNGEARRNALEKLWQELGGTPDDFPSLWATWTEALSKWKTIFEGIPFAGTLKPIGEKAVGLFPAQWGIKTQVNELIDLAAADVVSLDSEIARVAERATPMPLPTSDQDVLTHARLEVQQFKDQLVDSGVLPETDIAYDPNAIEVILKTGPELHSPELATVTPDGRVHLYPYEGHEAFWAAYGGTGTQVLRHELTHAWQYICVPKALVNRCATHFAQEAAAVSFELSTLGLEENPSPALVLTALKDERRRAALASIALRFHSEKINRDTVTQELASMGMDEQTIARFWMRMEGGASDVVQYWLGSRLFTNFVDTDHRGDLKAALTDYAHRSFLLLPPHVIQSGFNPGEHEVQASPPLAVRISQKLKD